MSHKRVVLPNNLRTKIRMSKINSKKISLLAAAYSAMDETVKFRNRDQVIAELGMSQQSFYYILKTGRTRKLQREVFAKVFEMRVEQLFPDATK
jgi:hypothetical protein